MDELVYVSYLRREKRENQWWVIGGEGYSQEAIIYLFLEATVQNSWILQLLLTKSCIVWGKIDEVQSLARLEGQVDEFPELVEKTFEHNGCCFSLCFLIFQLHWSPLPRGFIYIRIAEERHDEGVAVEIRLPSNFLSAWEVKDMAASWHEMSACCNVLPCGSHAHTQIIYVHAYIHIYISSLL